MFEMNLLSLYSITTPLTFIAQVTLALRSEALPGCIITILLVALFLVVMLNWD